MNNLSAFDVTGSFNSLQTALTRAQQLYPQDTPTSHIFLSMARNGSLRFAAKERGIRGFFQRIFVKNLTPNRLTSFNIILQSEQLRSLGESDLHHMVCLIDSVRKILSHIKAQRTSQGNINAKKLIRAKRFDKHIKKVLTSLNNLVPTNNNQTIASLRKAFHQFADRIGIQEYDSLKEQLHPQNDENFEALLKRIYQATQSFSYQEKIPELAETNLFAKYILCQ